MNAGNLSGVATAVLLAIFLGGWAWAWSARRQQDFDAAARLPLDDETQERRP
jgi:cytochrome c oxidase cbb3-type subunit IV